MTDVSNWKSIQNKEIELAKDSQAKKRFLTKQNEIEKRHKNGNLSLEEAKKEIDFFQERYAENLIEEKETINKRLFSPPVGVPLLPRLYYAIQGLINDGLKGAAYGWKKQARTVATPEVRANIDFQQIKDELAYFKQTKLENLNPSEEKAWNKIVVHVDRKASENEKWGINPKKFNKDLVKNLDGFVGKVRELEFSVTALTEAGLIKPTETGVLSKEDLSRNENIQKSIDKLKDDLSLQNTSINKNKSSDDKLIKRMSGFFTLNRANNVENPMAQKNEKNKKMPVNLRGSKNKTAINKNPIVASKAEVKEEEKKKTKLISGKNRM